jgi:dihydroorotate dehydrogenase (fumarate)
MANLSTTYAGLRLRNPFIISSSGLSNSLEKIRKFDNLGAGAIVLKSLFEEQISMEKSTMLNDTDYPEAHDYISHYVRENSLTEYLSLIRECKKAVSTPIIASINCVSASEWTSFAKKIEDAGADALELNMYILPVSLDKPSSEYEKIYFDVVSALKKIISIPVIVKLGPFFTNLNYMVNQLYFRKADAVVLFNRFYEPDINLHDLKFGAADVFSTPSDIRSTLRWVGIISSQVENMDIAASTGVHSGESAAKLILAGAKAVQVCSVLYRKGPDFLAEMLDRFEAWMVQSNFKNISDFCGKLNYSNIPDPAIYERAQFMKYFSSHD